MDGHAASAKQQKRAFEGYPSRREAQGAKLCLLKTTDAGRAAGRLRGHFQFGQDASALAAAAAARDRLQSTRDLRFLRSSAAGAHPGAAPQATAQKQANTSARTLRDLRRGGKG